MNAARKSDADAAHLVFQQFAKDATLLGMNDPDQSESDTRAKLIDPLFLKVLGWQEKDMRREEPAADGFADYSFGSEFKWFHVEAKRTTPRFNLIVPSRARELKLSGPHLLGNKQVKPLLEQAAKYSPDLGTQFAVLTNGSQFILFETTPRGKSWRDGHAFVWHDHEDVDGDFATFHMLLGRNNVEAGVLVEEFAKTSSITRPVFTPLQYVHNGDGELVRNPFWAKISQAFSPLLIDQPDNALLQEEIVRNCYVATPLAHESTSNLGKLLRDTMPKFLTNAGARDIRPNDRGAGSFENKVVYDLKVRKAGTYVLTGGVGSGKTSFLRRFATVEQHAFIRDYCVWLHVDFLPIGAIDVGAQIARLIENYTYQRIYKLIQEKYPSFIPQSGEQLRALFQPEIDSAKQTILFAIDESSPDYRDRLNEIVDELKKDPERMLHAILRGIKKSGKCIVFVLDNTDQQGEQFQRAVFLFSQKLADTYGALAMVSLREEKFFAAYHVGVFDAYGTRKFHIGSPELIDVIRARLDYGLKRYDQSATAEGVSRSERNHVSKVVTSLIDASTIQNGNIIRFLASVSAGDMRLALNMFSDFMSSGNTDVGKIMRILSWQRDPYFMPFHEFAKSAILGSRRYFRSSASRIINVFTPSAAAGASHWTACRVLARLNAAAHTHSTHGEGYVATSALLREYRESFGLADDFAENAEWLLGRGLLESEPPKVTRLGDTDAVRVTATGAYYWSYLIRSFAYLDLVFVDTPCYDENFAKKLASLAEHQKEDCNTREYAKIRIRRVTDFMEYLTKIDMEEIAESSKRGGPYTERISDIINEQLAREIEFIKSRTGA